MTQSNQSDERRHFKRIDFDANCTLHQGDDNWITQVLDISLKGLLTAIPEDWTGDESNAFEAVIHLNNESSTAIIMSVELAHKHQNQLGFFCKYIDLDSITHLKRLIELNVGDPSLIERELSALIDAHAHLPPAE